MKYLIVLLLIIGCNQPKSTTLNTPVISNKGTGKLIPIDIKDTLYSDARMFTKDTITNNGWKIKYFVKDDTTRYTDIYIQWEKGNIKRVYQAAQVLEMRSYFIPGFKEESDKHLFFEHGCATGCLAILALPKNETEDAADFEAVIDYDLKKGLIVYRKNYSDDKLVVGVTSLNKQKTKLVTFKNVCLSALGNCIDTVTFNKNKVTIKGGFTNEYGNLIYETKIVKF